MFEHVINYNGVAVESANTFKNKKMCIFGYI